MGRRKIEKSLGTADRSAAEALAAPLIADHKMLIYLHNAALFARKIGFTEQEFVESLKKKQVQVPFTTTRSPDGTQTFATADEIFEIEADGTADHRKARPNDSIYGIQKEWFTPSEQRDLRDANRAAEAVCFKDIDHEIAMSHIADSEKEGEEAKLLLDGLADFKKATGGKTLAQSYTVDAQALVDYYLREGRKNGRPVTVSTAKRRITPLRAMVNWAMAQQPAKLFHNPFLMLKYGTKKERAQQEVDGERVPFTESDMASIRANRHLFSDQEWLMWVWHASSSLRPDEIFNIIDESYEEGEDPEDTDPATGSPRWHRIRTVWIRSGKTSFSKRALPIPQAVLDCGLLPSKIEGRLFKKELKPLLRGMREKLIRIGVCVRGGNKVLYSARHRAKDRMTNREVPDEVRRAIMGHTRRDAHSRYGHGFTMWRLKPAIDKIGY
jgi:hypothetical protein